MKKLSWIILGGLPVVFGALFIWAALADVIPEMQRGNTLSEAMGQMGTFGGYLYHITILLLIPSTTYLVYLKVFKSERGVSSIFPIIIFSLWFAMGYKFFVMLGNAIASV